jgi:hypothetical protein
VGGQRLRRPGLGIRSARRRAIAGARQICRSRRLDLDPGALAAARRTRRSGVGAGHSTARTHAGGPVDLIVTNPPLGSRVRLDAAALLVEALPNLARQLAPRGRLVWITPAPRETTPIAERLKLRRVRSLAVDLGGVRGQLERWDAR